MKVQDKIRAKENDMSNLTDEQLVDEFFKNRSVRCSFWSLRGPGDSHCESKVIIALGAMFREHINMKQEAKRWRGVALYLADCHAANVEGATPNRLSKYDRGRFLSILEKAVTFIQGACANNNSVQLDVVEKRVQERCEKGIERIKELDKK